MSAFGGLIFTNKGRNLQAKAQAGTQLNFTRIAVGDGDLGGSAIADLNALMHQVKTIPITKLSVLTGGKAVVGGSFSNQDLIAGFYWKELGVFATDPDIGEILYCYGNSGVNAEYIPAGGGPDVVEKSIDVVTMIGNAADVTATIEQSLIYYTQDDVLTVDQTQVPASPGNGKISQMFNWLANRIKAITGKANWWDAPATTLENTKAHIDAVAPHSGHETPSGAQAKVTMHEQTADPHPQYALDDAVIPKSLATAASQFLLSSAAGAWVVKTVAEIKILLGLKSAAYTESTAYATAAQGTKADNALPKSGGTLSGEVNHADQLVTRPKFKDYAEKIGTTPATTGTCNFDLTTGNVFAVTPTGAITIGAVNPPTTDSAGSATIYITNGATVYAKTFAAAIKWVGDEIPDMPEANKTYCIVLTTLNGGTAYRAACIGPYSA